MDRVGPARAGCRRDFFPASGFLCSPFVSGSACRSSQSRFFPPLWKFMVSWETCVDLCLKKTSETHWFFCFYGAFSPHESSISATLVAACLFPDAVPDFMFSFHCLRWCGFWLCDILTKSGAVCWCSGAASAQEFSLLGEAVLMVFLERLYL